MASGNIQNQLRNRVRSGTKVGSIVTSNASYNIVYDGYISGTASSRPGDGRVAQVGINGIAVCGVGSNASTNVTVQVFAFVYAGDVVNTRSLGGGEAYNIDVYKF